MKVAYIAQNINNTLLGTLSAELGEIILFNSIEDFVASALIPTALIVSTGFGRELLQPLINSLRKSDQLCLTPIVWETDGEFSTYYKPLPVNELKKHILEIIILVQEIEVHNYSSWENRVLAYFYTRPAFHIIPELDKTKPIFYYYPHVEQFYDGAEDYFFWLEEMTNQNILAKTRLVDRIFCCSSCFSALLKFSDLCPHCGSINIRNEKFVHCFTCGHVAPESQFIKDGRMVCPSCRTKLRLIGEDYDRPLENGVCLDCGNYHIDSKLSVVCLTCNKTFSTEDLSKRPIYEYKLTDAGRAQTKFGTVNSAGLIVNELNYIVINQMLFMLDWIVAMQIRYDKERFGLIALQIIPNNSASGYDLMLELARFLRRVVRTTDMCSKLDHNTFIFLLPNTDSEGLTILVERIAEFVKSMELKQGRFETKIAWFSSGVEDISDLTARELLEKVSAKL
ncbi:MAG: hypothetical protein WCV63_03995 [Negativicutes bacterium]|jgi:hypothetical protein